MMYIPSVVGVAPHFTERRALAIGICLCGSGVGTFVLAPISQHILDNFGWRWVFRTFSTLCLFCVVCGTTMSPVQNKDEEFKSQVCLRRSRDTKKALSIILGEDLACSKSLKVFILIVIADFFAFTAIYIPYTHLPPLAKVFIVPSNSHFSVSNIKIAGVSSGDAVFLISAGGISNTIGR